MPRQPFWKSSRSTTWDLPMPDPRWLHGYSGESVDELIALEGKYRTDSPFLAFEQAMNQKAARVGKNKLTLDERVILAIESLELLMNRCGYTQLFVNLSRERAPIIVHCMSLLSTPLRDLVPLAQVVGGGALLVGRHHFFLRCPGASACPGATRRRAA